MHSFKPNDNFAGRYNLLELIGNGGFSEVWKAEDYMTDSTIVAIKIYAPESGLDNFGIRQFKKEYAITQPLFHPYLVKVYHFDIAEGSPYLVMPFFEKGSLGNTLHIKEKFTEEDIAQILLQIGGALAYLHKQTPSVIHQDIKPDNILLSNNGDYLLADFGISTLTRQTLKKATGSTASMTVAYSPPERFINRPFYNESGDIFSLGVMIYELCTKELPWMGYGGLSLLQGAQIPDLPKQYSNKLNEIVKTCMAIDDKARPTAQELEKTGKIFLEKKRWEINNKEKRNTDAKNLSTKEKSIKSYKPVFFVSATALLVIVMTIYFLYTKDYSRSLKDKQLSTNESQPDLNTSSDSSILPPKDTTSTIAKKKNNSLTDSQSNTTSKDTTEYPIANTSKKINKKSDSHPQKTNIKTSLQLKDSTTIKSPLSEAINYTKPTTLIEYLNEISDSQIPIKERKLWKKDIIEFFENEDVMVYDESEGIIFNKYTIESLIDFLLTTSNTKLVITHEERDKNKITQLHVEITPNNLIK